MRHLLPLLAVLPVALQAQIQWPICDTLPIAYDPGSILFTEADMSFGDSMIVVQMTNTSAASMAYPQVKLTPLTPLPPGMTQNTGWYTFASSWNVGDTMPAHCYFDVATPIPPDFMVTFGVYANNLSPLLADSCFFGQPFTLNLNPGTTDVAAMTKGPGLSVWPNPAGNAVNAILQPSVGAGEMVLVDLGGGTLRRTSVPSGSRNALLDTSSIPSGIYVLSFRSEGTEAARCRVTVVH